MTRTVVVARGTLAGLIAGLTEIAVFRWTASALSLEVALSHIGWLAVAGTVFGLVSASAGTERLGARLWFAVPSLIALMPLLTRRVGVGATIGLAALVLGACAGLKRRRRESVLVGGAAGALSASALGLFLSRSYDGRDTAAGPLLVLALVLVLAATSYAMLPPRRWHPQVRSAGHLVIATMLVVAATAICAGARFPIPDPTMAPSHRPPVVLVVLDTVRADHLELYGHHRETMPALARFANAHGVVVDRAVSNAPDSLSSHASLFTGLFPPSHGAHRPLLDDPERPRYGYPLRPDVKTMAERLRDHGYFTAGISANFGPVSSEIGFGLDRGFVSYEAHPDRVCQFVRRSPWNPLGRRVTRWTPAGWLPQCVVRYRRAASITDAATTLLERVDASGFFLFINYMDAHSPYRPPDTFRGHFSQDLFRKPGITLTTLPKFSALPPSQDQLDQLAEARYDEELLYLDTHLKRLLTALRRHPSWDRLLLIITSDHGEAFGEHDLYGHTASVYDVMIRVPLVIKPGRSSPIRGVPPTGSRWDRPMQLTDITPLVLRHAGIDLPALDGRLPDEPVAPLRAWSFPSQVLIERDERYRRELRSVELDGWKLIEDQHGTVELYDLSRDPGEQHNLAATHLRRVDQMKTLLGPRAVYRAKVVGEDDGLSPDALERLRSLGYIR